MKLSTTAAVALAASLIVAAPVLAQSSKDAGKQPDTSNSSTITKKPTSGMPVGAQPQKYGEPADKQKTSGMPVGAQPQKYGTEKSQ